VPSAITAGLPSAVDGGSEIKSKINMKKLAYRNCDVEKDTCWYSHLAELKRLPQKFADTMGLSWIASEGSVLLMVLPQHETLRTVELSFADGAQRHKK
jgi:hypothetical protein